MTALKMTRKLIISTLIITLSVSLAWSQTLPKLTQQFGHAQKHFAEKIYAHINKPSYLAGETMWFKLYNVNAATKIPTDLSKVAYVELLKPNYEPELQALVELKDGLGSGSLVLPTSLTTGNYIFRAYTNLMKNGGASAFFEQKLSIINAKGTAILSTESTAKYTVSFFPEGGNMVEGIAGNVAIKVIDEKGKGVVVNGVIVSDKNDTVSVVKTTNFGLGKFIFSPKAGNSYEFIGTTAGKEILLEELPTPSTRGYSLMLNDTDGSWDFMVTTNEEARVVYAVVHNGQKIAFASENSLVGGKASVQLAKDRLEEGLHHLTIFNINGKPVAERIFYKPFTKQTSLAIDVVGRSFSPRQKVAVAVSTKKSISEVTHASMSVYKIEGLPKSQIDIVSYLHLSSELRYAIENPTAYLSANPNVNIDDLLLTQQWRRFNWNNSSTGLLKFLPEYNGNLISGNVLNAAGKPVKGIATYFNSVNNPAMFYHTKTDSLGNFLFNPGKLLGPHELIVQTNAKQDSTSKITINSPFYEPKPDNALRQTKEEVFFKKTDLDDLYFAHQVDEFYGAKAVEKAFIKPDTVMFYGKPEVTYVLSEYTKFNALEDVMREYVSEVTVQKRQKSFNFKIIGGKEFLDENPLVLYDGVPYVDIDKMMAVSPGDIQRLEIVRDRYYYNGETYSGIIHFRSRKANVSDYELNPNAVVIDYEGLQLQRVFPEQRYDSEDSLISNVPNYKTAVYWNPSLKLKDGKPTDVSFFTPDLIGRYQIVIQGISSKGTAFYEALEIDVKDVLGEK